MANQWIRLNLASAIFPFYTEAAGRTIIVPGQDENFDRYNAANTTPDKGVPQVFYMHNVVPISGGFQSIGYDLQLLGMPGHTDFDTCYPLISSDLSTFLFVPAQGQNYIYDGNVGAWASVSPISNASASTLVTTAYVQGVSYIFYQGIGCFTYNNATMALDSVSLTGLTITDVIGICAANGYLIAWTKNAVVWSSLTDPTNFIPSIQTGAGGGSVADAKGSINFCVQLTGGFLIYCEKNIVGASYTANTAFPYIILEVTGSGGVASIDMVAYQGNLPYQVAMTTAGIQQVSLNSAIPTMPEVSDFLTAQLFEDFDETTKLFTEEYIGNQLFTKFFSISNRFIVISYGPNSSNFTHAIVYDIALNRYGKFKITHRSCFPYIAPAPHGSITFAQLFNTPVSTLGTTTYADFLIGLETGIVPKANLAFMQEDGTVQLVDFQVSEVNADGVFIIGKFQFTRNNVIIHQKTDVESVNAASTFDFFLLPTFDGKDFSPAIDTTVIKTGTLMRTYAKRYTASNISLCLIGAFNLTTLVMNFTVGGSR